MQCRDATTSSLTFGILTEYLRGFSESIYLLRACNSGALFLTYLFSNSFVWIKTEICPQSTSEFSYACWISSIAGRKESKEKRKQRTPFPKRRRLEQLSLQVLQHGWAGVGQTHHILLPPTERWQEVDIGQISVLLVSPKPEQHTIQ